MPDAAHPEAAVAEQGTEAFASFARTMADVARLAMDQGQEAVRLCFDTMTGANAPVAESTYAQGRQMMANGGPVLLAYRQMIDRSMDDMQAMVNAYVNLGRGLHNCQRTYTDAVRQTVDRLGDRPQQLFRAASAAEAARLQRELYAEAADAMIGYNIAAFQALSQAVQEALRPLHERSRG